MHFLEIVDNAEELPLGIYFLPGTQSETIKLKNRAYMGKGWLGYSQAHGIYGLAGDRIYLAFHFLGETVLTLFGTTCKVSDLTDFGAFGMPQAFRTELTGNTG